MFRAVLPASSVEHLPPIGTNVSFQSDEPGKIFHYRETAQGILTVTAMARAADVLEPLNCYADEKKKQLLQAFEGYPLQVQNVLQQIFPEAIHVNAIQDIDVLERWSMVLSFSLEMPHMPCLLHWERVPIKGWKTHVLWSRFGKAIFVLPTKRPEKVVVVFYFTRFRLEESNRSRQDDSRYLLGSIKE